MFPVETRNGKRNERMTAIFLVLAGPGFAIMDKVYVAVPEKLKSRFKGKDIRYPGTPFPCRNPPFLWTPDEQRIVPMARLHYYWGDMAQYNDDHLEAALQGDMAIGLRYGFDADCSATADCLSAHARKGVSKQHHTNVGTTLPFQNIVRPFYALLKGTRKQLINALAKRYRQLDEKVLERYVDYYLERIGEGGYFDGTGQNPPLFLDASRSFDQLCDDFANIVGGLFDLYEKKT
ncbi:hypothetical protein A3B35_02060 [Candidatus Kaiserbacteria bacterium RIFCSPLOWO2_01_FULL_54_24]|uniref:Uncharacterized protein n=1 Tax=Candidatus Kaiserbacteria bacterium RIFCSPLOWO2_01_FULL_54_24 TaxID=1798515 RepID=A0A1F6ETD3_9BACT|nr:MAG: hypothetical protein A3B35_02060 [Candidatus Kaiserbacteria bacterium RIFCSPLOWO2_01_FULL_54_24]